MPELPKNKELHRIVATCIVHKDEKYLITKRTLNKKAKEIGIKMNEVLLGLYEGIPKTKRGAGYFGVLPDKITIFQQPIKELVGHDGKKLKKLIYEIV